LPRRLGCWRSRALVAVVAVVFVALVLDAGRQLVSGPFLTARRLAGLQLENMALQSCPWN
jgi:hypothetical protein